MSPNTRPNADIWGVLPIKNIEDAKQRLSSAVGPAERRELFRAMVRDVLEALASAQGLAGLLVVTRHPEATTLARGYGATVLSEPANDGQTAAVTRAARHLVEMGVSGMLAVPGDIPLATGRDLDLVIAAHRPAPAFTIVPAHDGQGSNAVACSPPDLIPFAFGNSSFEPHLEHARQRGIEPTIVPNEAIALDVDNPSDLATFAAVQSDTRAARYLIESGLRDRLSG